MLIDSLNERQGEPHRGDFPYFAIITRICIWLEFSDRSVSYHELNASKKKIHTFLPFARERSLRLEIQTKTQPLKQLLCRESRC